MQNKFNQLIKRKNLKTNGIDLDLDILSSKTCRWFGCLFVREFHFKLLFPIWDTFIINGFGDIIIPKPHCLDYPLLLEDMPEVNIYAYSLETVVAEKFQTMIDRGVLNSRMKDFYDVYTIIQSDKLDKDILASAICEVFRNRVTEYYEGHPLFNGELKNDSNKQMQWKSFLKKIKYQENLSFEMVVDTIINFLDPYWILLKNN
jgi:hypothetical protein